MHSGVGSQQKNFASMMGWEGRALNTIAGRWKAFRNGVEDWINFECSKNISLGNVSFVLSLEGFKFHVVWCNRRLTIWGSEEVEV